MQREREVERLEQLEMQYIQRLQATQAMQKESYAMLERALTGDNVTKSEYDRINNDEIVDYNNQKNIGPSKYISCFFFFFFFIDHFF